MSATGFGSAFPATVGRQEHLEPERIAANTWLVREYVSTGSFGLYVNSLVIGGAEPVIVDTGREENRHWFDDVFSVVRPEAVRWVFISSINRGTAHRLSALLAASASAQVLCSSVLAPILERSGAVSRDRLRVVSEGETIEMSDRILSFPKVPLSRSIDKLGLFDEATGVFWASDAFGTALLEPVDDLGELHPAEWRQGFQLYHRLLAPWLRGNCDLVLEEKIKDVRELKPRTLAGAYTPAMSGYAMESAFDLMQDLTEPWRSSFPSQGEFADFLRRQFEAVPSLSEVA